MGGFLRVSIFIILAIVTGDSFEIPKIKKYSVEDTHENLRDLITDHHKETMELFKVEMETTFNNLFDSVNKKLNEIRKELEITLNKKLSSFDSKIERTLHNLTDAFAQLISRRDSKMEMSIQNLSQSFNHSLSLSGSKILSVLESQAKLINNIQRKVSQVGNSKSVDSTSQTPIINMTSAIPNTTPMITASDTLAVSTTQIVSLQFPARVEVEEINVDSGKIEFRAGANSEIKRKIWIFMAEGTTYFPPGSSFEITSNNLGDNAHLSLWSDTAGLHNVWNGTETDWMTKKFTQTSLHAQLYILTLTVDPSLTTSSPPAFKLSFKVTKKITDWVTSVEVVVNDGVESVSFPPQNTKDIPPKSSFRAVLASKSGRPFRLTLKFLELPGSPQSCREDGSLHVIFLQESPTGVDYKHVDASYNGLCGWKGNTSELLGTSSIAILRFYSLEGGGRGFRVEFDST